jgi:hypothetical protein
MRPLVCFVSALSLLVSGVVLGAEPEKKTAIQPAPSATPLFPTRGELAPAPTPGTTRGAVAFVDIDHGFMLVAGSRIEATPQDLARFHLGQTVQLDPQKVGDRLWLPRSEIQKTAGTSDTETFDGTLTTIDRPAGTVMVTRTGETTELRTHPDLLQGYTAGDLVRITVENKGGVKWITELGRAGTGR